MLRTILFMLALLFTFTASADANLEVATKAYKKLFKVNLAGRDIDHHTQQIVKNLFVSKDSDKINAARVKAFTEEIKQVDVKAMIASQKISEQDMFNYSEEISRRLVGLGIILQDECERISKNLSKTLRIEHVIQEIKKATSSSIEELKKSNTNNIIDDLE